jgi:hypothetical protein
MPNWCENQLTVLGSVFELDQFIKEVAEETEEGKTALSFGKIVPMPEELKDMHIGGMTIDGKQVTAWREVKGENGKMQFIPVDEDAMRKKHGYCNWYQWSLANWGTKWGVFDVREPEMLSSTRAVYRFDTAWSPPVPLVEAAARKYPSLTFDLRFWEGGCAFKGRLKVKGDEVIEDWTGHYNGSRGG